MLKSIVRYQRPLLLVIAALFPLCLLADLESGVLYNDWYNHIWVVGYFGEFLKVHHRLPLVLNTNQVVGAAFPLFYAYPFYALGGILSSVLGSNVAVRLIVCAVAVLLAFQVYSATQKATQSRVLALTLSFVVSSAPYQLTNIFARGDFPEYIGASLVLAACCAWLRFCFSEHPDARAAAVAGLLYVLGAWVHPITALLGGLFCVIAFLAIAAYRKRLGSAMIAGLPLIVLAAAVLSPWLYIVLRYGHDTGIVRDNVLLYFPGLDDFWSRLSPLPQDLRVVAAGAAATPYPYLDLQINFPLLLLTLYLWIEVAIRIRRGILRPNGSLIVAIFFSLLFIVLAIASTVPAVGAIVLQPISMLQFAYRTITYADALLFLTIITLAGFLSKEFGLLAGRLEATLFVCFAIALHSDFVNFAHVNAIYAQTSVPVSVDLPPRLVSATGTYFGTPGAFARDLPLTLPPQTDVRFKVATGTRFGDVLPVDIFSAAPQFLKTNISAFAWNIIVLDGTPISTRFTFATAGLPRLAVVVPGKTKSAQYQFSPDSKWRLCRIVSLITLLLWLGYLAAPRRSIQQ